MFEKRATLFVQEDGEQVWKNLGMGGLKIVYDADMFGSRIVMEADNSQEIISNTVISMDTIMQVIRILSYYYLRACDTWDTYHQSNYISSTFRLEQ